MKPAGIERVHAGVGESLAATQLTVDSVAAGALAAPKAANVNTIAVAALIVFETPARAWSCGL